MWKMSGSALCVELGPFTRLPSIEEVDCKFFLEPGSLLDIQQTAGANLERVIVAIHAEFNGLLERSLARLNPSTGGWEYMRRTNHPARQGAIVEITGVPAGGEAPTCVLLEVRSNQISFQIRCEEEVRRTILWGGNPETGIIMPRSVIVSMAETVPEGVQQPFSRRQFALPAHAVHRQSKELLQS